MINKKRGYRKAVFIVVYKIDEKTKKTFYIILKRKLHWKGWEFPKGGIDDGEKSIKTALRETKEETGLKPFKIKRYSMKGKYLYTKFLKDRPKFKGQTYELFSAEVKQKSNQKIKLDPKEHSNYIWLPFDKAIKKLSWPNQKKCLKIVNKNINNKK
jgi:8-oxo-dGTP pyrophosphatase MutT (NUDIX family)